MEHSVEFRDVKKSFGKTTVIEHLDLAIREGERIILLGPSGCGKSTILRMISGLETVTSGELFLDGELANDIDAGDRSVSMVFQNYALFPHMNTFDNIAFGLRIHKVPAAEVARSVADIVKVLNLDGYEQRLPRELSGGQRQRVALARALVARTKFLLLDEPLSNLDAQLRGSARKELVALHEMFGQTFIYVTHDQVEAMTIGQRIALVNGGKLQMLDTPNRVYRHPANVFTAQFIGSPSTNIIPVQYEAGEVILADGQRIVLPEPWARTLSASPAEELLLGIRPEDVTLVPKGKDGVQVTITYVEDYGNRVGYYFTIGPHEVISISPEAVPGLQTDAAWRVRPEKLHFFDATSGDSVGDPPEYDTDDQAASAIQVGSAVRPPK